MTSRGVSAGGLIVIAVAGVFLTLLTSGLITTSQTVPTTGAVSSVNVGVYTDTACTLNCTSINWGSLTPGSSTTKSVYIKNTGTLPVTLSMTTGSWSPSNANTYLSVGWNRAGYVLNAGASISASLTLTTASNAANINSFSFNIIITGTNG